MDDFQEILATPLDPKDCTITHQGNITRGEELLVTVKATEHLFTDGIDYVFTTGDRKFDVTLNSSNFYAVV